jgi:hypothetical protein
MAFEDITDPAAVREAIAEFRRIGPTVTARPDIPASMGDAPEPVVPPCEPCSLAQGASTYALPGARRGVIGLPDRLAKS